MFPKKHIIYGAIFSILLLLLFPKITLFQGVVIFLSTFLVDVDHYIYFAFKKNSLSLKKAYRFFVKAHKMPTQYRRRFVLIFHTAEFLIIIAVLAYFNYYFFLIFIGIAFHSILDIINMSFHKDLKSREFFLIRHILKK
jgi:hypothetical protein